MYTHFEIVCVLIKLPAYIFIDSFVHNRVDSWSNGLKDYNLLLPLLILMCKFSLVQPEGAPASRLCVSSARHCCSMRTFLLPDATQYSGSSAGSGRLPGALVPLAVPALLLNSRSRLQSHLAVRGAGEASLASQEEAASLAPPRGPPLFLAAPPSLLSRGRCPLPRPHVRSLLKTRLSLPLRTNPPMSL